MRQPIQPIAAWNCARGVWEAPGTESLLCEHSDVYSQTWPTSGMTRGGVAYALPTSAHPTADTASSLLPTPTVSDSHGPGVHGSGGMDLRTTVTLLPTPTRRDHKGHNQRGSSGDLMLPSAVAKIGAPTSRPSPGGPQSWDVPLPLPLSTDD